MAAKVLDRPVGVKHTNFYENIAEAQMRLLRTVIVYDHNDSKLGVEPYLVYAISNHQKDGVFRIYLEPLHRQKEMIDSRRGYRYPDIGNVSQDNPEVGRIIDKWMEQPSNGNYFVRKKMDSKYFNNFRPFPLGMCNAGGKDGRCFYLERQPARHREQGLTASMVTERPVTLNKQQSLRGGSNIPFQSAAFRATVRGEYPDIEEVLKELRDPNNGNEAVAFHRLFAIIKGPMDLMFLGYKDKVVGVLPNADLSEVRLGREFGHTREAVAELGIFDSVVQK